MGLVVDPGRRLRLRHHRRHEQTLRPPTDVVPDGADVVDGLTGRVVEGPVLVPPDVLDRQPPPTQPGGRWWSPGWRPPASPLRDGRASTSGCRRPTRKRW